MTGWRVEDCGEWVDVLPVDDLLDHEPGAGCVCGPSVETALGARPLVSHASLDGRELDES